jgi:2-(3-amino-3-carboxypropyl)histidine synthase
VELYGYELEFEQLLPRIKADHPNLEAIGLQFPDGMRDHATEIGEVVERELGCIAVSSADPCYGACDLCDDEFAKLGLTVMIHFGHSEMPSVATDHGVQVYFVPARSVHPVEKAVTNAIPLLPEGAKRIGLTTTAQHVHKIPDAKAVLRQHGFEPVTGRGDDRTALEGQLLGCNVLAATWLKDVDAFLYLGSGDFHPLALALDTQKPIVAADPYTDEAHRLDAAKHRILKQRYAAIGKAKAAQTFGIVISTKGGQIRFELAKKILRKLKDHGKQGYLIQNKQISPGDLLYYRHLDAFVGTACPRVPIDDQGRYDKPFLTPQELDIVLGIRKSDLYVFDTYTATSR